MPSRKRNKGKERRAKKDAATLRRWEMLSRDYSGENSCNHGCVIPQRDHAVSIFMNKVAEAFFDGDQAIAVMRNSFGTHPEVWSNAEYRQLALCVFLNIGTNLILAGANEGPIPKPAAVAVAREVSVATLMLECYDGEGGFQCAAHVPMASGTMMPLTQGGERDILKFYSKRLSCACLKAKHKQARKTLPKTGICLHCKEEKGRSSLVTCGRCKVPFYCSRKCQVAHYPKHEDECTVYVGIRKTKKAQAHGKKTEK